MSQTRPLDPEKRPARTPRQLRRYVKKLQGDWGCYPDGREYHPDFSYLPDAEQPKNRPTPRRADARAAMLERRRG